MKLLRRLFAVVLFVEVWSLAGAEALAQSYPVKPIRFIVGFTAGGGADTTARLIAPRMSERMGQQLVIENRGGAGGTIGASLAAKAAPDGYTILLGTANLAAGVSLFDKLPFDPLKDFAPITLLAKTPSLLAVHPSLPVKSVKELIALAKAHPGKINYAGGVGSLLHLDAEYFKTMAKIDLVAGPLQRLGALNDRGIERRSVGGTGADNIGAAAREEWQIESAGNHEHSTFSDAS